MSRSAVVAEIRTPRESWVVAGLVALAAGGPDAVRVEALAKGLGVTKGGFYGFFADRDALLAEMLDRWERESVDDVLASVERIGGDPRTKVRRAGLLTLSEQLMPIDLAVRGWARRDPAVARRLRRVDGRRMAYLRAQFTQLHPNATPLDIEARCLLAFALLIGNHFIAARHSGASRADVLLAAAELIES
jgi:AcrR family transcriptional regulator